MGPKGTAGVGGETEREKDFTLVTTLPVLRDPDSNIQKGVPHSERIVSSECERRSKLCLISSWATLVGIKERYLPLGALALQTYGPLVYEDFPVRERCSLLQKYMVCLYGT